MEFTLFFMLSFCVYSVGRQILTKKPNVFDSDGDSDRMDIIDLYKPKEGKHSSFYSLLFYAPHETTVTEIQKVYFKGRVLFYVLLS